MRRSKVLDMVVGCTLVALASCRFTGDEARPPDDAGRAGPEVVDAVPLDAEVVATLEAALPGPPAPTLFFLAGLKGYTEPCGCTVDVVAGGIDRIVGTLDAAKAMDNTQGHLVVDAGDMLFEFPEIAPGQVAQQRTKASLIVDAELAMGTRTTTPGPADFALGKHFYLDTVRGAGIEILAANLTESEGVAVGPATLVEEVGALRVGLVGLVSPSLFGGIEGIVVTDPTAAAHAAVRTLKRDRVDVVVAVLHGKLRDAKELAAEVPEIDFIIVGQGPRKRDEVDVVGDTSILEAFDQGRALGALKLFAKPGHRYHNARVGSDSDRERVDRRIEQVEGQIARIPRGDGTEPPFLTRLREQLAGLQRERAQAHTTKLVLPDDASGFVFTPLLMLPGLPLDPDLTRARLAYNASLRGINLEASEDRVPPVPGQSEYVGSPQCAACHMAEFATWKHSRHSEAVASLEAKNKRFDGTCIGCHVTGYLKPGGSALAETQYSARVADQTLWKDLREVGCESCHGPGSEHILRPVTPYRMVTDMRRTVGKKVCVTCHTPEHSPKFDYPTYVRKITGDGHMLRSNPEEEP